MRKTVAVLAAGLVVTAGLAAPAAGAGSVRSSVSLTAPAAGGYATTITLSGRLWRTGTTAGITGATVMLQRTAHGGSAWGNLRSTRTGTNGTYSFQVTQTGAYDYRAYYAGSATYTMARSPVRYPVTTQRVPLDSIATTDSFTGAMQVRGHVIPAPPNGTVVTLQRLQSGAWYAIESGRTTSGNVTIAVNRPAGTAGYRLMVPARSVYAGGASSARSFANYVWRGAFARPVVSSEPSGHYALPTPADNPRRDRITLVIGTASTTTIGIDTTGCKRIQTSTESPPWDIRTIHLSLNTARVVAAADLEARRIARMTGDLTSTEHVTGLRHVSEDRQIPVDSSVMVLCAN